MIPVAVFISSFFLENVTHAVEKNIIPICPLPLKPVLQTP
jgi:hypothetical protein